VEKTRSKANRQTRDISDGTAELKVKESKLPDGSSHAKIEYSDAARIARQSGESLIGVLERIRMSSNLAQ
jgi:uncharacterized protein (DUF111 family)